jgi:hypothetical protein
MRSATLTSLLYVGRTSAIALLLSAAATTWGTLGAWGPEAHDALVRAGLAQYLLATLSILAYLLRGSLASRVEGLAPAAATLPFPSEPLQAEPEPASSGPSTPEFLAGLLIEPGRLHARPRESEDPGRPA